MIQDMSIDVLTMGDTGYAPKTHPSVRKERQRVGTSKQGGEKQSEQIGIKITITE